ncbi:hypothetical protein [Burkholderia pseudomallei]|uniref:hypothetical protein n=1 Tax=Burkholderia pseudomallei TaxID=28450 RepID=UPI0021F6F290|nr:hypothetical protein [Burkholderia pseudomallei]MCW0014806.1 hypothetical protein [Burkholderia pseudomallei]
MAYFHADSRDDARGIVLGILSGMVGRNAGEIRISDPISYQDMVASGRNSDLDFRIFEIFDEEAKTSGWVDSPLFFSFDKSLIVEWMLFLVEMSSNLLTCYRGDGGKS